MARWLLGAGALVLVTSLACPPDENLPEVKQLSVVRVDKGSQSVQYEVRVVQSPASIQAFGLDVQFDPRMLTYEGSFTNGGLTSEFDQLGANEIASGTLRVGGYTTGQPVPPNANGVLAVLDFGVVSSPPNQLLIVNRVDDVSTFSIAE